MRELEAFLVSTETRFIAGRPRSTPRSRRLAISVARGGRASFQIVVRRIAGIVPFRLDALVEDGRGVTSRVRRVSNVPLPHYNTATPVEELCDYGPAPTLVPDPLHDDTATMIGGVDETVVYWVRLDVEPDAEPGIVDLSCRIYADDGADPASAVGNGEAVDECTLELRINELVLEPRKGLEVVHWFYADTVLDWYGYKTFDEGYWGIVPSYMANLRDHGVDVLYTPVFTAPTDGERRPSQLVEIGRDGNGYRFDFRDVERYIGLGRSAGFELFEFPHLFSQWGAGKAIPLYEGQGAEEKPLLDPGTGSLDHGNRSFLAAYLPKLKNFLESKELLDKVRFHISDEPHGEEHRRSYVAARALVRELAPWMRVMDAVSEISYGAEGLTDLPVPTVATVGEYLARGISCGTYYCCNPRGRFVNRQLDTPLLKIKALGWLLYRFSSKISLFLHWGYNYWYRSQTRELIDPFAVNDGGRWPGWAYGDTFVVYPGPDGPIDSIRWEAFAEGLEDFRLLQSAGITPDSSLLGPLAGFDEFPRAPEWYAAARGEAYGAASAR